MLAGHLPFKDSNLMEMYLKISKAEYKFPNWFPPEVRKMLSRILDPNPYTRISIAKIMQNSWFRKGLKSRQAMTKAEDAENFPLVFGSISGTPGNNIPTYTKLEVVKPTNLNAFDIIYHSARIDLSGLFVSNDQKDEVQFTSTKPVSAIISKLEDVAGNLKLKVKTKDQGFMRLEGTNKDINWILSIDVEIFEITSSFHLVEVKKSSGDSVDYQKMLRQDIRPALREIVWSWQGEQEQDQKES